MDSRKVLTGFEKTHATWRAALERGDEESYGAEQGAGGWTLGQICDHVAGTSQAFLDGAELLARGEGEERGGGMFAFLMCEVINGFPPFRFKVPPNLPASYARVAAPESISKAEALERLDAVARRTREMCDAVAAAPKNFRSKHPAAGWLNARQWYQMSEMHMRHHLRQLRRIEKAQGP
ncbi:MAG: DinB family protein [Planctomycetota bacterium]|jgi:hypothetical protein